MKNRDFVYFFDIGDSYKLSGTFTSYWGHFFDTGDKKQQNIIFLVYISFDFFHAHTTFSPPDKWSSACVLVRHGIKRTHCKNSAPELRMLVVGKKG